MRFRLPHPLVLLLGGVAVAALLTWTLPAGPYQRRHDAATDRDVVVAGTYARVPAAPVGPLAAVLAVPKGIVSGADVILTVLFVGGVPGLQAELDKIYVRRDWHRRGIGRELVDHVARRFLSQGVSSMLLFGDASNPSNGFHEHLGAERLLSPEGEFHGGYGWRDLRRVLSSRDGT